MAIVNAATITDEHGVFIDPDGTARPVLTHPLSVQCRICNAHPDQSCCSMAKRWQAVRSRTLGVLDNGLRKRPHKERVLASRVENERRMAVADAINARAAKAVR